MNIDEQLQAIDNFMDSEKGKLYMENYFAEQHSQEQHNNRWVDRVYERVKDNIDESIEHLNKWYDSPRYRDREYKLGYEPRERLLWILFDIAEKYGRPATEEEWDIYGNMFTGVIYVLGSYSIQVMHGQGSVIRIDKMVEQ